MMSLSIVIFLGSLKKICHRLDLCGLFFWLPSQSMALLLGLLVSKKIVDFAVDDY
jgi:hypothetical protein